MNLEPKPNKSKKEIRKNCFLNNKKKMNKLEQWF